MTQIPDEYLDLKGLSTYSKMGVSTLRYHIRVNDMPWFRMPGKKAKTCKILVKRSEFDSWIERFRASEFIDTEQIANEIYRSLSGDQPEGHKR